MIEFEDVKTFDCHDMQKYIKDIYGREVNILQRYAEIDGNNTFVLINVNKEFPDEMWWPKEDGLVDTPDLAIQRWIDGDDSVEGDENLVLWDMCRKGLIPEGVYLMQVWW